MQLDVGPLMGDQRGTRALAKVLEDIGEQYQHADRVNKLIRFRNETSQSLDNALKQYGSEKFEDIENEEPDYLKSAREEIRKRIEDVRDPILKGAMLQDVERRQREAQHKQVAIYESKKHEYNQTGAFEDQRRLEIDTINATPDDLNPTWPDAVQKRVAENLEARKKERDTGLWTAEQYQTMSRNYFRNVTIGLIDKDPGRASVFLETYKDFIEPQDYVTLKKAIEAEAGDKNVLDAYAKLYTKYGGDASKMRMDLLNPEIMKELGLDVKQVKEVESLISDQEKTKRATYEQTESEYFKLLQGGKLKKSRIILDLDKGLIDAKGAEHWTKAITETVAGDDPQAIILMHDNIARGSIMDKGTLRPITATDIMKAPGISMKTKTVLLDKFYTKTDKVTGEAEKQAKDYIKSQLVSTSPLGSPIPAEYERLYKAYEAIDKHADDARRAGKPWTIDEYMKYAKQLSDFYRPTMESKVQDYQEMFGPRKSGAAKTAKGVPVTSETKPVTIEKRKPGETINQYLKRTGRE